MDVARKYFPFLIKIMIVLIIPYYLVNISTRTTSINFITGIWGHWPLQIFTPPVVYQFWQPYQLLIALLFITPLIIFAYVYRQKQVDRRCILSALGAVSISCIATYLFTPQFYFVPLSWRAYNVVPNVISLSIFIFVFWPLLQKTWSSTHVTRNEREEKEGVMTRLRNNIVRVIPLNAATAVWVALAIMPAIITVINITIIESHVTYVFTLAGGLYNIQHEYFSIIGRGYYPTFWSDFYLITAGCITMSDLLVWTLNMWTGITALNFVKGEATKRRVYILMTLSFLVYAIPSIVIMGVSPHVYIPLPIFQIFIIFVMKYVRLPVSDTENMIRVPFRTRISSKLRGKTPSHESREVQENIEGQELIDDL